MVTCSFSVFFYNLRAGDALCSFGEPFSFVHSIMLCVRHIRSTGLPMSWGDVCDSISLTGWVTHDPSTGVRATTSLRGERAQQAAYSLPSHRFSLALSFPQLSPLLWGTDELNRSHDFMRQTGSFPFCAASWKCAALGAAQRGMGKEESGGLGEKTRKGKGDCSRAAPPSPGLSPQASGKTLLRKRSTQKK